MEFNNHITALSMRAMAMPTVGGVKACAAALTVG